MEAKAVSYSSDLLQPPVGPGQYLWCALNLHRLKCADFFCVTGVAFVRKELRGTKNFSRGPPKTFRVEESSGKRPGSDLFH